MAPIMHTRILTVFGVIAALFVHGSALAQEPITPTDQWHGTVSGRVDRVVGAAVELDDGRAYRYRTDNLAELLTAGDDVRLNRDYIQKQTPDGLVLVHTQRQTFLRGSSQRTLPSSELDQAFAQCRANWPAD